ncbi:MULTISPECIES: class I SAM-dependent methyltransferase [Methylorubrum]|uniref:Methyltransferase domain-containing protein n=1 Tax=Methylorubrum extorquens (strain CM4 / NCIMB 13688) TaxID=440085 RepID=B7KYQ2_METC4|nr:MULTISPECIES: hypothetical protein [Methylorubrum]ACK84803.1 conserved hypothetical protein [Methylorubrum extorquens CM4]MCY1643384.1 hypothetical protein [Methylorubrum sp. SL192]
MTTRFESRVAAVRNSFDIFDGQWCSDVPLYGGGPSQLFFDTRIKQFDEYIGGFAGKKILELGPLEAGHTYAMNLLGANDIISIEANIDAFLRCLVVKEAFDIKAKFICGDFEKYMRHAPPKVDVVLASGVLYHMKEPLELIDAICSTATQCCFWTHYYDKDLVSRNAQLSSKISEPEVVSFKGRDIVVAKQSYLGDLDRLDFAGGLENYSYWVSLEGLRETFEALGFEFVVIEKQENHPHGPGITFVAKRK